MTAGRSQVTLLLFHFALFQTAASLAGGFIGAYLLASGFSLAAALMGFGGFLAMRFCLRFASLRVVKALGYRRALALGTGIVALQFIPLAHADRLVWFGAWMLCVAVGEALYWPVYHAAMAVSGDSATRGRQVGLRTTVQTIITVIAPVTGAFVMTRFGPAANFWLATASTGLSVIPILMLRAIPAGPIPSARESLSGADRRAMLTFLADGWISAGLFIAWPMILFVSLGSDYAGLGLANAAAGLVGAVASHLCGRGIDRGQRGAYLKLVCLVLAASLLMRAAASWAPWVGWAANLSGAAVTAMYIPVLMSSLYDRAKRSGATFRFHLAMEAAWDTGAVAGCATIAGIALVAQGAPSLVMLPALAGVALVYRSVRGEPAPQRRADPALVV